MSSVFFGISDSEITTENVSCHVNKIGGSPSWIHEEPDHSFHAKCDNCGEKQALVVQLECPIDHATRCLYVFVCIKNLCWSKSSGWSVYRMENSEVTPDTAISKANATKKEQVIWDDNQDDWGSDDEEDDCPDASKEDEAAQVTCIMDTLSLGNSSKDGDKIKLHNHVNFELSCGKTSPTFPSFYMNVWSESDFQLQWKDSTENAHVESLLVQYQSQSSELDKPSAEAGACGGKEEYEKSKTDKRFRSFNKCVRDIPDQIVRYWYGGEALLLSGGDEQIVENRPGCARCGGKTVFEFQLMPALIPFLRTTTSKGDGATQCEYGTVLVYTCAANCWEGDSAGATCQVFREQALLLDDPDQKLFKK